ncbi:MAG: hypothetical protein PHS53_02750 [Candidatus Pacebacteria bacterium]|nr:hypothetical protein [Candidatus Paceibacterota bacterium]MDD5357043.1 hypothetical protein [Candidatus Paceibacterota bacterium]
MSSLNLDFEALEREVKKQKMKRSTFTRLGKDWAIELHATHKNYIQYFETSIMQKIMHLPHHKAAKNTIQIYMVDIAKDSEIFSDNHTISYGTMPMSTNANKSHLVLKSPWFRIFVKRRRGETTVLALIREGKISRATFGKYFQLLSRKILFALGIHIFHAAALRLGNKTILFDGESGAGKSTTTLSLAKSGAQIISEDHTLIRREKGIFFASGYEELSRVTSKTEKHIFGEALPYPRKKIGKYFKKEFPLRRAFDCVFFKEFRIDFIFFLQEAKQFQIRELSKKEATLHLVKMTKPFFTFSEPNLYDDYMNYMCALTKQVRCFNLERDNNLKNLDTLIDFLRKV